MPGKKTRLGPYRLPDSRKVGLGDTRDDLARRAKRYLRELAVGRSVVEDPDSEVRQSPKRSSNVSLPDRSPGREDSRDDDED